MVGNRLRNLLVPSVRNRIYGGFAVMQILSIGLAVVTYQLLLPLDSTVRRLVADSTKAETATTVSLAISDARALVMQYTMSATVGNTKDTRVFGGNRERRRGII
jgi:hypothetical protein